MSALIHSFRPVLQPPPKLAMRPSDRIDGGAIRGSNLFHSFQEFNVDLGRGVYFTNPDNITNILSRVTGSSISKVDGTLGVLGNANLFLINPNGIIFGKEASLDINGSFFVGAAKGIHFDLFEFSATDPTSPPLLEINLPLGLQMGQNLGEIQSLAELKVKAGRGINLVGGSLKIDNGHILATDGTVKLAAIQGSEYLPFSISEMGIIADYTTVQNFGDVSFSNAALIDTSGNSGGRIEIYGNNISIESGSRIFSLTNGNGVGKGILINAQNDLELTGFSNDFFSSLSTENYGSGQGGSLQIQTSNLNISDQSFISTMTLGAGAAGNLSIKALNDISIIGNGYDILQRVYSLGGVLDTLMPTTRTVGIFSGTGDKGGQGGNLLIMSKNLALSSGAIISNSTFGSGDWGEVNISVQNSIDINQSALISPQLIGSIGSGNNLEITSDKLILSNGSYISNVNLGRGRPGNIFIRSRDISIIKKPFNAIITTGIISATGFSDGRSGNISIDTHDLTIEDGGQITAQSGTIELANLFKSTKFLAGGSAGNITINATGNIFLSGISDSGTTNSAISAETYSSSSGGNIQIRADNLTLQNQAEIQGATGSNGTAGSITITSNTINVTNQAKITSETSGVSLQNRLLATGFGGDIFINSPYLTVSNSSEISVSSRTAGDGGNLNISSNEIRLRGGSLLSADTTASGNAGIIDIQSHNISLQDDSQIDAQTSGSGNGGSIQLTVQDQIKLINRSEISASTASTGNAGDIILTSQYFSAETESSIRSNTFSTGRAGNIRLNIAGAIDLDAGAIEALTTEGSTGNGGDIFIDPITTTLTNSRINLGSDGTGIGGNLQLTSDFLHLDRSEISSQTRSSNGGSLVLNIPQLLTLQNNSLISTQAGAAEAGGNGGNITINGNLIIGTNNSDIIANAFNGNGGNINIITQGLLGFVSKNVDQPLNDPQNNITASSRFGSSGTTNINTTIDPSKGLADLTSTLVDPSNYIADRCAVNHSKGQSQFIKTGRGGLPVSPLNLPTPVFLITSDLGLNPPQVSSILQVKGTDFLDRFPSGSSKINIQFDQEQVAILNDRASLLFDQGNLEEAYKIWQQSSDLYAELQNIQAQRSVQLNQLQTLQLLGFQTRAYQELSLLNEQLGDDVSNMTRAVTLLHLGNSAQSLGKLAEAQTYLSDSLTIAQTLENPQLTSQILLSLGHNSRAQNQIEDAIGYYRQAETIAPDTLVQFQAKVSELALGIGQALPNTPESSDLVRQAQMLLPSRIGLYSQIYLASLLQRSIEQPLATPETILKLLRHTTEQARILGDTLSLAYSLGSQGQVYETIQQWEEAQQFTQQALNLAQPLNSSEVNYALLWQLGRVLNQQGQTQKAIVSYRQSVEILQGIRTDIVSNSEDVQFNFRDSVEPLYRQFVQLFLTAENTTNENLLEARNLIENLQLAELNDYFQDACTQTTSIAADQVDPTAAVIYPIILDDRLDVIVSLGKEEKLLHYSHPISAQAVEVEVDELRRSFAAPVRSGQQRTRQQLQRFYDWLIQPIQAELETASIETLVFIADGALRNLPVSALYNGDRYLIEDYNVVLSPGLKLMDPRSLPQTDLRLLAGGLSDINTPFINEFNPLPFVRNELDAITAIVPNHQEYLNEDLVESTLVQNLKQTPFNVVHLATHGEFGNSADETYLLTWDSKLNLDEFSTLLQQYSNPETPIELLVLSACKTAAGNDRAVLGIAGMAIRSNARSAIAGLWPVNDEATAIFMTDFYQALIEPGTTKSQAFRQAQLNLLRNSKFEAPYYWSPYVLVGNWL